MEEISIRPYTDLDRDDCLTVFGSNVPDYFLASERGEFEEFLAALPGPYFGVVDADASIVGCGGYALADRGARADLCWGMIHRRYHSRGWGRWLAQERIRRAVAHRGVREIVVRTSQYTHEFYARLGFELESVETNGWGPDVDRYRMRRRLSAS